jgi:hypothetical protein
VLLNPNFQVDDHKDFAELGEGRVITIDQHMSPENNLEVQSAVIANSELFIGTYGGLSYLAPLYGVPAMAFYSDRSEFLSVHLETAHAAFQLISGTKSQESANAAPFTVLGVSEIQPIIQLLAAVGRQDSVRKDRDDDRARRSAPADSQRAVN